MRKPWIGKFLWTVAALGCGGALWLWYRFDPRELQDELAARVAAMDVGRSLRGPALLAQGENDAPFVCVVAWDPFDAEAAQAVRDALRLAKLHGRARVVVLPVRDAGPVLDVGAIAFALSKDGSLWPWLAEKAAARDEREFRDEFTRRLGRDRWSVLLDEAADQDTVQAARVQRRIADGLELRPGEALVNGVRVPAGRADSQKPGLAAVWQTETERMRALIRVLGDRATLVQPAAIRDAGLAEPAATRYLQWIVRMQRIKQT
ncbi:MAG: universal stress protein [Deltaproteobacteria bacterium]|nr:universal stress protein [Deltaproteobacteria bacterium]